MDPEDVLDFGEEDEDGLDVISLGGSDHNGDPLPANLHPASGNHNNTRSGRSNRSPLPGQRSHSRAPQHQSDRRHEPSKPSTLSASTSKLITGASASTQNPLPGERASYMPPDRPQAMASAARYADAAQAHASSKLESRRSLTSSSNRSLSQRQPDTTSSRNPPNNSAEASTSNQDAVNREKGVAAADQAPPALPKGWMSRLSKQGKVYYVNAITRTSQWTLPTEAASGVAPPTKPATTELPTMPAADRQQNLNGDKRTTSNPVDRRNPKPNNLIAVDFAQNAPHKSNQSPHVDATIMAQTRTSPEADKSDSRPTSLEVSAPLKSSARRAEYTRPTAPEDVRFLQENDRRTSNADADIKVVRSDTARHVNDDYADKEREIMKSDRRLEDDSMSYRPRDRAFDDVKNSASGSFRKLQSSCFAHYLSLLSDLNNRLRSFFEPPWVNMNYLFTLAYQG